MFRSLIHFEFFLCVYCVIKCSSFILLQVVDQFCQHYLLKRLSLIHCIFLPPLSKTRCQYVSGFISVLSILFQWFISVFVPVPYCLDGCGFVVEPEVRQVDSSSSILLSQDCFGCSRFFVFPYKLWHYLFLVTLNSFRLCWVFAARWKLLGPLDCSLPSLADLLLTSAESWLVGAF